MIRSMTGFGRHDVPLGRGSVTAEVKTVNGRHLEVRVRLPREIGAFELPLQESATGFFARGRVDVSLRLPAGGIAEPRIEIDAIAARSYADGAVRLRQEIGLAGDLSVADVLSLPGVVRSAEPDLVGDEVLHALRQAVEGAARAAAEMRSREGRSLDRELRGRLDALRVLVTQVEGRADDIVSGLRERLARRVAALAPELSADPSRLEQEIVFYADRMDVTEETVRLHSHLEQFRETLEQDGAVGRKLEFLLQELGREVNTIGSKATDVPQTRCVVEMKTELEKIREQVMNVE